METTENGKTGAGNTAGPPRGRPYAVFLWGALVMAAVCFGLAAHRLGIQRPARADAYTITGILGLLGAAMAWSLGAAHERSRRSQQSLQDSLERLREGMGDMPRSLMEESVKVAAREAEGRRADQERQARELREALEGGLRAGFAPVAPALAERIEASLGSLADSLRQDREERARGLREMSETVRGLQAAQQEWARESSALLERLREQGALLNRELGERDSAARSAWTELAAQAADGFRAAADIQLEKVRDLTADLARNWDAAAHRLSALAGEAASTVSDSARNALETALREARAQWEALRAAAASQQESLAAERTESLGFVREHLQKSSEALLHGLSSAAGTVKDVASEAEERLRGAARQAESWLGHLSGAAERIGEALQDVRRGGEESEAQRAEWRATVDMFHQGLGGLLDRLQSLASLSQGHEALLRKMESAIRAFEERSAELLEETALKAQESLLDALDQAGGRSGDTGGVPEENQVRG